MRIRNIALLIFFPFFVGCSCSSCLQDDISMLYEQEGRSFISLNSVVPEFFRDEIGRTVDLKSDLTRQFDGEILDSRTYFENLQELFCSCL